MKRKGIAAILLTLVLVAGFGRTRTPTAVAQGDPLSQILAGVNAVRAEYGLPPYQWNAALAAAAQNQASYMATNNIYSHTGAGGSSPQTRALAAGYIGRATENIVGGTNLTPSQGVIWWRNSATHFNTMISNQYIHAGVGFAQGHDQNFYALVVGVPGDAIPAVADTTLPDEALAPVAPIVLAAPREDGSIVHTIGSGQSLWAIAARYEIPLEQLLLYNNLSEASLISPGDTLLIRLAEGQEPPPTPTPPATYIVRAGDSAWTIAARHRLSLDEFLWLNAMAEESMLYDGMEVRIRLLPGEEPPPTPTPQLAHIVRNGDTLWGIAVEYGLSLDQLLAFNNLSQNALLSIGDSLLVVEPTPLPTETPLPTATPPPTETPRPTQTPQPSPTIDPASVAAAMAVSPTPDLSQVDGATNARQWVAGGTLVISLGLLFLAGLGVVVLRKGGF